MDLLKILESVSIIIASLTASLGILAWRSAERWKRKYELAEEVLTKFYESQQIIRIIKSPFGVGNEGKSRERNINESMEESAIHDRAYIVYERFEKNKDIIEKLQSLKFRFISHFGKENEKLFVELTKIINEIFSASQEIASISLDKYARMDRIEKGKRIKELHQIIYSTHKNEDDPIEKRVTKFIGDVEKICNRIIGGK
jgi:hypothetical protein